mmetsp:Transcript_19978/g.50668  ORF Transcript_19978/g.50668 Transcript_19978/m.50668 type:complete len:165 (+) Transcript_19978:74-568(+)
MSSGSAAEFSSGAEAAAPEGMEAMFKEVIDDVSAIAIDWAVRDANEGPFEVELVTDEDEDAADEHAVDAATVRARGATPPAGAERIDEETIAAAAAAAAVAMAAGGKKVIFDPLPRVGDAVIGGAEHDAQVQEKSKRKKGMLSSFASAAKQMATPMRKLAGFRR